MSGDGVNVKCAEGHLGGEYGEGRQEWRDKREKR